MHGRKAKEKKKKKNIARGHITSENSTYFFLLSRLEICSIYFFEFTEYERNARMLKWAMKCIDRYFFSTFQFDQTVGHWKTWKCSTWWKLIRSLVWDAIIENGYNFICKLSIDQSLFAPLDYHIFHMENYLVDRKLNE